MKNHTGLLRTLTQILFCVSLATADLQSKVERNMNELQQHMQEEFVHESPSKNETVSPHIRNHRSPPGPTCRPTIRICSAHRHQGSCLHAWHDPSDITVEPFSRTDVNEDGFYFFREVNNDRGLPTSTCGGCHPKVEVVNYRSVRHPNMYLHVGGGRDDVRLWADYPNHDGSLWREELYYTFRPDVPPGTPETRYIIPAIRHWKSYLDVHHNNKEVTVYDKVEPKGGAKWYLYDGPCV